MKKFTMYTLNHLLDDLKFEALIEGGYDEPYTSERYDNRLKTGKYPRYYNYIYKTLVRQINALQEAIDYITKKQKETNKWN